MDENKAAQRVQNIYIFTTVAGVLRYNIGIWLKAPRKEGSKYY